VWQFALGRGGRSAGPATGADGGWFAPSCELYHCMARASRQCAGRRSAEGSGRSRMRRFGPQDGSVEIRFVGIYFPQMRTSAPSVLPLFRSEMQLRLLGLLLLQPERRWRLSELADDLGAPNSSVHRELERAEAAGIVRRDASSRPHQFQAAGDDPLYEPLAALLHQTVGVEGQLRDALKRPDVEAAVIYGSWASGTRHPGSDIDVLVVGNADLRELRRQVRPIGKAAGRAVDVTVFDRDEFRRLLTERSSFARRVLEAPTTPLVGDMADVVNA